jgi:hypothetical protein
MSFFEQASSYSLGGHNLSIVFTHNLLSFSICLLSAEALKLSWTQSNFISVDLGAKLTYERVCSLNASIYIKILGGIL